jgi:hypothetical protein
VDFELPRSLVCAEYRLEPLGPEHDEGDYRAWTSSIPHIRATPGFAARAWPVPMTLAENLGDGSDDAARSFTLGAMPCISSSVPFIPHVPFFDHRFHHPEMIVVDLSSAVVWWRWGTTDQP